MIFQGIRTSIPNKPNIFAIFQGVGVSRPPVSPPSGSAHVVNSIEIKYKHFPFNVEKTAAVVRKTIHLQNIAKRWGGVGAG